ncbi:MAG: hypothetical protein FJZ60_01790 [Chlamydiae bacterium]|nr:hypothetical protein [Chlamydiota bacterium]
MIGILSFFAILLDSGSAKLDPANYPMKEGTYQVQVEAVASNRYPNGIQETGKQEVRNEVIGQKWVTDLILAYTDGKGQSFRKQANYETTFFKDVNGEQKMFKVGTSGNYRLGTVNAQKDGSFTIESEGMSNLLGKVVKTKSIYSATKTGYSIESTYYDEASKKWFPMRSGTYTRQ